MIVTDIPHVAQYLLEKYNLTQQGWKFVWDNARRRAGQCRYREKEISLSRHYVTLNVADHLDDIIDTILHEIAHALAGPGTHHGPEWVAACGQVGARPERCYDSTAVTMPRGRYTATCNGCGKVFHRHRRVRAHRSVYHIACGPERGLLNYKLTSGVSTEPTESVAVTPPVPKRLR